MADSSYLTGTIEPFVVDWASKLIGTMLTPQRVVVGTRMDGTPVHFAFDGVSVDRQIGLLVSTSQTIKPGGLRKLHVDASILLRAPFSRRIMAFINGDVLLNFLNKCDALLPLCEIEMLVCDSLPGEMLARIQDFQAKARKEVGDKGKTRKPGGKRR